MGSMSRDSIHAACVLVYTKPARPGRVKTRLVGDRAGGGLSAAAAAELHGAFLGDVVESLRRGRFELRLAWALEPGDRDPEAFLGVPGFRQRGEDLGARLDHGLRRAARRCELVAAVGSDHPELAPATVEDGLRRLAAGADVVLGPTPDGGYYLIGLRRDALRRELFDGIAWSTESVLAETLERCRELGLSVELLPAGHDVDVADDLRRLALRLGAAEGTVAPRTRALLAAWGRLP